jgi:hypothetical protein
VQDPQLTRILTSDGTTDGAIAESGFTYDSGSKSLTIFGTQFIDSASGNSITTGTTILQTISCTSGSSAQFDYFVNGSSNQIRSGFVLAAWNCTSATYTETSTQDLNGSTEGISFQVDVVSNNVRLKVIVTDGSWEVKVGSRIIF